MEPGPRRSAPIPSSCVQELDSELSGRALGTKGVCGPRGLGAPPAPPTGLRINSQGLSFSGAGASGGMGRRKAARRPH